MKKIAKSKLLNMALVFLFIFNILSNLFNSTAQADTSDIAFKIEKTVDKTEVYSGEEFTYTIKYANPNTTVDANNVVIRDELPSNIKYVSSTPSADIESVKVSQLNGQDVVIFKFKEPMKAGISGFVKITAKFPEGITLGGSSNVAKNTASIKGDNGLEVSSNEVTVTPMIKAPDWNITKSKIIPQGTPALDQPVTYRITLSGNSKTGGVDLHDVSIVDTIPTGAEYITSSNGGVYNSTDNKVTWNIGNVAVGSSVSRTVTVKYPSSTFNKGNLVTNIVDGYVQLFGDNIELTNQATASHSFDDAIVSLGNFSKTSRQADDRYSVGQTAQFKLNGIENTSNVPLDSMEIVDNIPAEITLTSISTGRYSDTANIEVQYEIDGSGTFIIWPGSPFISTNNHVLNAGDITLNPGEKITGVKWIITNGIDGIASGFKNVEAISVNGMIAMPSTGNTITNDSTLIAVYAGNPLPTKTASKTISVIDPMPWIIAEKTVKNNQVKFNMNDTVEYHLRIKNHSFATGNYIDPIAIDVVPVEMESVQLSDITWSKGNSNITLDPTVDVSETKTIGGKINQTIKWSFTGNLEPGQYVDITYTAKIKDQTTAGTVINNFYITTDIGNNFENPPAELLNDVDDLDGDSDLSDKLVTASRDIFVNFTGSLDSQKWVKGELDADWGYYGVDLGFGKTLPGGIADYQLKVKNIGSNGPISNIVVIDILPYIGDVGVIDSKPRDTDWRPYLVNNITEANGVPLRTGIKVYYSTNANPSKQELSDPINKKGLASDGWSETPPADITSVRALKFDFGSSIVLEKNEEITLEWPMRAPYEAPAEKIAWNSFGYGATYPETSGQEAFLPSEPKKVGFEVQLDPTTKYYIGNFVWEDMNKNGMQDFGELGINGILVKLYKDLNNGVGIPSYTDTYRYTRTGNNHSGQAGYYEFPNLAPGNYKVEFIFPKEYKVTPYKQGSDIEVDSNLEWLSYTDLNGKLQDYTDNNIVKSALMSDEIVLGEQNDFSIDTGLYKLASLGDFVWNDKNANGIQDSTELGIANAKVELLNEDGVTPATYADGSNVPAVFTNATGGYKFNNLEPGKYKVRFTNPNGYYKFSDVLKGTNSTKDSNGITAIDGLSATTEEVTLKSGEDNSSIDQGMYLAQIGDYVWHDKNANGKQDDSSAAISGVTVKLTDSFGSAVKNAYGEDILPTTTNSSGKYSFEELKPGIYKLEFTKPTGYDKFSPQDVTVSSTTDLNDSDADRNTGITGDIIIDAGDRNTTVDAGFYKFASIGDKVWNDRNGNGIQDTGTYNEPGISGVTVNLYKSNGTAVGTTTTDSNGNYAFNSLDPEVYYVEFVSPSDYVFSIKDTYSNSKNSIDSDADTTTGKTANTTLASGENDTTWDAGLHKGYIGNYVWEDVDGNGRQDDGSTGINGVVINLYDATGTNKLASFTTQNGPDGKAGYYEFTDLDPANYFVEVIKPATYEIADINQGADSKIDSDVDSSGRTSAIQLTKGQIDDTIDIGLWKPASIGDYLWEDKNGDGIQNAGENGINGAIVSLYKQGIAIALKTMLTADNTGNAGYYLFDNLKPGNYYLKFDMPLGYDAFTFINKGTGVNQDKLDSDVDILGATIATSLISGENDVTWDAGVYKYVTIGDKVWRDSNMNGTQDPGEPGLQGVTVNLYKYNGSSYDSKGFTTTDGSGNYIFDKLEPGQYKVEFVKPSGYAFTTTDAGADDGADSDASALDGKTTAVTLTSAQNDLTLDAGLYKLATVGDFVWDDKNANGIQEPGEMGKSGVVVQLFDKNNNLINTTTTGVLGEYSFVSIEPGDYYLKFAVHAHYALSEKDQGSDDGKDSDVDTVTLKTIEFTLTEGEDDTTWDMGIYKLSSLSDYVFEDMNADGIQDVGDKPLANFTVRLLDSNDNVIKTTTTDSNGKYLFDDLKVGDYYVEFVNNGYVFSPQSTGSDSNLDSDANSLGKTDKITLGADEHFSDIDAGLYKLASIGDYVWLDKNNDGKQDDTEPGLSGISVKLLDKDGNSVKDSSNNPIITVTEATGKYSFTNLVPGEYSLEFESNKDFYKHTDANNGDDSKDSDADKVTGKTDKIILKSGDNNLTIDAGFTVKTGIAIEKTVYAGHDEGKSTGTELVIGEKGTLLTYLFKVTNTGDTYLNDVEIQDTTLGIDKTKMIKISGIEPVAPGASLLYYYETSIDGDLTNTANTTATPSDSTGETVPNVDKPTALDIAKVDEVKPGIDVQKSIYLGRYNSGASKGEVASGKNGEWVTYVFSVTNTGDTYLKDLVVDDVTLGIDKSQMTLITGLEPLAPGDKIHYYYETQINGDLENTVVVTATPSDNGGTDVPNTKKPQDQDTANAKALGSIGDYLWYDNNGDGKQDSGEPALAGVDLNLLDNNGIIVLKTTTGQDGKYIFDRLIPGKYTVEVDSTTLPQGLKQTYELDSSNDGKTEVILIPNKDTNIDIDTVDFGYYKLGKIGNYVWGDINGNGIQEAGEKGIKDVTVNIYKVDGTFVNTTVTDANGLYKFDSLVLGDYYVEFVKPSGYEISQINSTTDNTLDSDAAMNGKTVSIMVVAGTNDMTWDAGLYVPASVGDYLWYDDNGDGNEDPLERSLPGVKLNLLDSNGKVIDTKTTDSNGKYVFDKLIEGEYTVVVDANTLPQGLKQTYELDGNTDGSVKVTLVPGQNLATVDFGYYKLGVIGNYVWGDINGNGIQETGEKGIKDVTIKLYKADGTVVDTSITDINGLYEFDNLVLGDYYVEIIKPLGYEISKINSTSDITLDSDVDKDGKTVSIKVVAGTNDMTWDAGLYVPASIGDYLWYDNNDNGNQDLGEPVLAGVTLKLLDKDGNEAHTTVTTDFNGKYIFDKLIQGEYTVVVNTDTLPQGLKQSYELDGSTDGKTKISLLPGQHIDTVDFGYYKLGIIGNYVWGDINGNGIQEAGEKGIKDVTVNIYKIDGTFVNTTVTDANGLYKFDSLVLGDYYVEFVKPSGYEISQINSTTDNTLDSDAAMDGKTVSIMVVAGTNDMTWDAGLYVPASIGDYLWYDSNMDGKQDFWESPLTKVKLNLLDSSGKVIATRTTDSTGKYVFDKLIAGEYTVEIDKPTFISGLGQTYELDNNKDGSVKVTLAPGQVIDNVDFGYYVIHVIQLGEIGDYVWEDANANGIQDSGEKGIKDVIVNLYKANGTLINTTATDEDGLYKFQDLYLQEYYLEFVKPAGYEITQKNANTTKELDSNVDIYGKTEKITVLDGTKDMSFDAGMYKFASVGDYVWYDTNGNGIQDANEKGIPNVKVTLNDIQGKVLTTVTDNTGKYIFENLLSGSYSINIDRTTLPQDLKETYELDKILDGKVEVILSGGQFKDDVDFGYNKNGVGIDDDTVPSGPADLKTSLGDYVWLDTNGNGEQESKEKGIAGVKLILTDSQGIGRTTITDDLGKYIFESLPLGEYTVTVDKTTLPKGVKETYELDKTLDGKVLVTLNSVDFKDDVDFGYNKNGIGIDDEDIPEGAGDIRTSVGDHVWHDINGNGKQEPNEKGIAGVKLILTDLYGNERTTLTDSLGKYIFKDLPLARYIITIDKDTLPKAMKATYELDKSLDGKVEVTLVTAEFKDDVDFGYNKNGFGIEDDKIPGAPSNPEVKPLPKTGTENYNLLLSGIFMLLVSTGFIMFYRRKED